MWDLPGSYIRDIVELAGRWKVAPDALLAGLPLTPEALADPTTRVPLRVCEAVALRAHQLTGEPALAFHLGVQMRLSSHGFLGFAAMTASTAREALDLAVRFASTRTSAIGLALYVEGDSASLVIEERAPLGALRELSVLALVVGIWQLGRTLTGAPLDGYADCAFPEPAYIRSIPIGDRLRFDRPAHRMVFAASILDMPLVTADAVATKLAKEQCERELAAIAVGVAGRVRAALAERPDATLAQLARAQRVSPRTFKRKLAEEGTTFTAIRDDLRRQRALLLLDNSALSVGEIAAKLGYTELPNFTRAFRRWTGTTPVAYRGVTPAGRTTRRTARTPRAARRRS